MGEKIRGQANKVNFMAGVYMASQKKRS